MATSNLTGVLKYEDLRLQDNVIGIGGPDLYLEKTYNTEAW